MAYCSNDPGYLWANTKSLGSTTVVVPYTYGPHFQLRVDIGAVIGLEVGTGIKAAIRLGLGIESRDWQAGFGLKVIKRACLKPGVHNTHLRE